MVAFWKLLSPPNLFLVLGDPPETETAEIRPRSLISIYKKEGKVEILSREREEKRKLEDMHSEETSDCSYVIE